MNSKFSELIYSIKFSSGIEVQSDILKYSRNSLEAIKEIILNIL